MQHLGTPMNLRFLRDEIHYRLRSPLYKIPNLVKGEALSKNWRARRAVRTLNSNGLLWCRQKSELDPAIRPNCRLWCQEMPLRSNCQRCKISSQLPRKCLATFIILMRGAWSLGLVANVRQQHSLPNIRVIISGAEITPMKSD